MIPLQSISQTKYIIEGDTIIGYNPDENRKIALLFLEGDYYKEISIKQSELVEYKDEQIVILNNVITIKDSIIQVNKVLIDTLDMNTKIMIDQLEEAQIKTKRYKNISIGASGLSILLFIILIL